ncbi:MAG: hypothetical protein PHQ41_09990, partial [Candidatus Cloacimonetes bacterium]|nr:hypothetical protein [Candidatus Cloacimonadota bacterium]
SIREERIRLLFPDATPGTSFENYKQNELQNALDTLPPDQLNRYNWLVSKDQELRGELTKIIGSQESTPSRTVTRRTVTRTTRTAQPAQAQSQFTPETQKVVDKYVKNNKINISQMAKDAVAEGYRDYKGGKDVQDKWNNVTKELGIAGEFSEATELAVISRLYGDKSGSINIERMIADGYSEEYAEKMLGVGKQQYADIKTVSAYKTDDGNVDVIKMINDLPQADVQRITGITDTEYHDLKQVGRYMDDQGNVDVAAMVESGATYSFLNRALNISRHDYDKIKTHFEAQEILEPYVDNGQLNLVGAVEAGHLGEILQVYDINNEDLQQVFNYLELKSSGYIDDSGNVDVIKIIADGKVSEQTLTGALNLDTETLNTYKTVAQYLDADGNVDLVKVVEDGKLPEIQQVYNLSNDDLTRVFSYLELEKAGYVNDDGNVDVLSAIRDDKITDKVITGALNLDAETLNTYKTVAQYLDADGNVDLVKVVEDGKLPDVQKVLNLGNEELTKAFDYLEIKGAGYVDDEGNVNVIKAIADGKVSDRTLTNALDLDNDTMTNYKAVANYVDDEGNIDVLQAITDDVSYDILSIVGIGRGEYDNLKTISQYTDKEGQIDVVKALYHGVDPDMLQKQLDISDKDMKELKDYAKYEYWEPDKGISVNDLEAKLDTPGQPEWTKVIMAMKAAGVITSDGIPVDDEGYPIAGTALKKEWNKLTPEQKQAVADEWMGSWERVAVTGDKAMAGLEELTQKISSDKKAPKWVTEALKVVFPQLHMFDYIVNPEAKAKVDEVKTNVQNWVHSQINTHLRQHSIDDPSKGKRFAMGAATAVADIVSAIMIDIPIALHGIGEQVNEGEFRNAAAQSVALGGGMLLFPVTLPKKVLKETSSGAGYVAGTVATLVLGPGSIIKLAKKGRAYIDPYGIPDRMAAIEFSTGRVPISKTAGVKLVQELVTKATKEIVSGKESGVIRKGGWELKYRTTPIQRSGASAVWHGTPDATPFAKLKPGETFVVDPSSPLFTSAYATPRFVGATSMGKPAVKPGYVMVITDAGKIMTRTTGKKGLTGPFKTYKGKIETEVVANPKSTFTRAKNLRTRILGPKAGEFFTQYMGPDVPGL